MLPRNPPPLDGSTHSAASAGTRQAWLLRGGVAFVFAYAAVTGLVDQGRFEHYVPLFVRESVGATAFLVAFAAYEALLAVALLIGRTVYVASLLAALTLVSIVLLNLNEFDVLFRNVAIASGALALAEQSRPARSVRLVQAPSRHRRERARRPRDVAGQAAIGTRPAGAALTSRG